jgi:CheY-like chemotaxis protein
MAKDPDFRSVLIVDNTPQILVVLARLFHAHNIRALLSRDSREAIEIAARNYVPIDLVLANVVAPGLDSYQLVDRLREIRPGLRALYMSAKLDCGVIRLELLPEGMGSFISVGPGLAETGYLIESVRSACTQPLRRTAGATQTWSNWTVQ